MLSGVFKAYKKIGINIGHFCTESVRKIKGEPSKIQRFVKFFPDSPKSEWNNFRLKDQTSFSPFDIRKMDIDDWKKELIIKSKGEVVFQVDDHREGKITGTPSPTVITIAFSKAAPGKKRVCIGTCHQNFESNNPDNIGTCVLDI